MPETTSSHQMRAHRRPLNRPAARLQNLTQGTPSRLRIALSHQSWPSLAGVFLSMPSAYGGGSSMAAIALAVVVATAGAPAGNPLADEFLRFLSAARDALSGAIIVRF